MLQPYDVSSLTLHIKGRTIQRTYNTNGNEDATVVQVQLAMPSSHL